jgi:hypothetical protein
MAGHTAIFSGKAAPGEWTQVNSLTAGYYIAKLVIRLIVNVSKIIVRLPTIETPG